MGQEKSLLLEDRVGHSIMPVIMKAMDQETSLLLEDRVGHPIQIKDIGPWKIWGFHLTGRMGSQWSVDFSCSTTGRRQVRDLGTRTHL